MFQAPGSPAQATVHAYIQETIISRASHHSLFQARAQTATGPAAGISSVQRVDGGVVTSVAWGGRCRPGQDSGSAGQSLGCAYTSDRSWDGACATTCLYTTVRHSPSCGVYTARRPCASLRRPVLRPEATPERWSREIHCISTEVSRCTSSWTHPVPPPLQRAQPHYPRLAMMGSVKFK